MLRLIYLIFLSLIIIQCNPEKKEDANSHEAYQFSFKKEKDEVNVLLNGKLFTSYMFADSLQKPVLYPIYAPGEIEITRSYPLKVKAGERVDHLHHIGLWFTYGEVNDIDFWTSTWENFDGKNPRYGRIAHKSVEYHATDDNKATLSYQAEWQNYKKEPVMLENTEYTFSADSNHRIIDRITTFKALENIHFEDSKEGMYAIRVCRELELPEKVPQELINTNGEIYMDSTNKYQEAVGNYFNSENQTGRDVWGQRAKWVALEGEVGGTHTGILFIDHPDNVGYPSYWMARWYGLFGVNPLGAATYSEGKDEMNLKLNEGDTLTFKYRIVIYGGTALKEESINQFVQQFHESY